MRVVYQYGKSHISGGVRRSYRKWRHRKRPWTEVTSPVEALTGSDSVRMRNQFPRFFLTIVVVQNVPLRMTDMATASDVTWAEGGSIGRVRACTTRRCATSALVGSFERKWRHQMSPVELSLEVTWVPLMCSLWHLRPITLSFSSPFTGYLPLSRHFSFTGSTFNNYIFTKVCCFRICSIFTPSSLSRLRCIFAIFSEILTFLDSSL